jgi:tRNA A22 N-methylase
MNIYSNSAHTVSLSHSQTDIFSTALDSTIEIYNALTTFASAASGSGDGIVQLPNGQEVDVTTLAGMTTYSVHIQFLQAHKELIDNIFVFIKNLENKLDNMLGS